MNILSKTFNKETFKNIWAPWVSGLIYVAIAVCWYLRVSIINMEIEIISFFLAIGASILSLLFWKPKSVPEASRKLSYSIVRNTLSWIPTCAFIFLYGHLIKELALKTVDPDSQSLFFLASQISGIIASILIFVTTYWNIHTTKSFGNKFVAFCISIFLFISMQLLFQDYGRLIQNRIDLVPSILLPFGVVFYFVILKGEKLD